jgi:HEAT repeat protein
VRLGSILKILDQAPEEILPVLEKVALYDPSQFVRAAAQEAILRFHQRKA